MKNKALKPSSLPDLLKRQKKFYAWLADYERELGRKVGPWSYDFAAAWREIQVRGYVEFVS